MKPNSGRRENDSNDFFNGLYLWKIKTHYTSQIVGTSKTIHTQTVLNFKKGFGLSHGDSIQESLWGK